MIVPDLDARRIATFRARAANLASAAETARLLAAQSEASIPFHDRSCHESTRIERAADRADGAEQAARNAARVLAYAERGYREVYGHEPPEVEPEPARTPVPRPKRPVNTCLWCQRVKPIADFPRFANVCRACFRATNPNNTRHNDDQTPLGRDPPEVQWPSESMNGPVSNDRDGNDLLYPANERGR